MCIFPHFRQSVLHFINKSHDKNTWPLTGFKNRRFKPAQKTFNEVINFDGQSSATHLKNLWTKSSTFVFARKKTANHSNMSSWKKRSFHVLKSRRDTFSGGKMWLRVLLKVLPYLKSDLRNTVVGGFCYFFLRKMTFFTSRVCIEWFLSSTALGEKEYIPRGQRSCWGKIFERVFWVEEVG